MAIEPTNTPRWSSTGAAIVLTPVTASFGAVDQPRFRTAMTSLSSARASVSVFDVQGFSGAARTRSRSDSGPKASQILPWALACNASWIVPHEHICWLMHKPQLIRLDANGRLHALDGPALCYGDGSKIYAWKGILLPARIIVHRESIDVRGIEAAHDPQIRRCMIDILTPQRFIEQGGAYRVAQDETGILWRQRWRWEAWAAVEVVNGTPEPDGTYKHYFLQVPPTMRTPREAVAWTYGLSERHYRLAMRT